MPNVSNKHDEEQCSPDGDVSRRSKNEGFVDGEEGIHVGELRHSDRSAERDMLLWRGGSVEELEIFLLVKVVVEGAYES